MSQKFVPLSPQEISKFLSSNNIIEYIISEFFNVFIHLYLLLSFLSPSQIFIVVSFEHDIKELLIP